MLRISFFVKQDVSAASLSLFTVSPDKTIILGTLADSTPSLVPFLDDRSVRSAAISPLAASLGCASPLCAVCCVLLHCDARLVHRAWSQCELLARSSESALCSLLSLCRSSPSSRVLGAHSLLLSAPSFPSHRTPMSHAPSSAANAAAERKQKEEDELDTDVKEEEVSSNNTQTRGTGTQMRAAQRGAVDRLAAEQIPSRSQQKDSLFGLRSLALCSAHSPPLRVCSILF